MGFYLVFVVVFKQKTYKWTLGQRGERTPPIMQLDGYNFAYNILAGTTARCAFNGNCRCLEVKKYVMVYQSEGQSDSHIIRAVEEGHGVGSPHLILGWTCSFGCDPSFMRDLKLPTQP